MSTSIVGMNNTTEDKNTTPPSDEELSFYCVEWPVSYDDDILEAFMVYISGLDPIAKERALDRLKIFILGLEASLNSIPETEEARFTIPRGPLLPQSLRFGN